MSTRIGPQRVGLAARQPSRRLRATREIANHFVSKGDSSRFVDPAPAQTFPSAPRSATCAAILTSIARRFARVETSRLDSPSESRRGDAGQGPRGSRRPHEDFSFEPTDVARAEEIRGVAGGRTPDRLERVSWAALLLSASVCSLALASPKKPAPLPILGTTLKELPAGKMKVVADRACLSCHSADMLRQQRLTEKQWTSELTKMTNWGSDLKDSEKEELLAYLVKNFGPDNDRFEPVVTKPVAPPPNSKRR